MLPRRELANLRRSCVLITSSVDCCRAGHMWGGPARSAGLATPLPDRAGEQAGGRQQGMTEAKVIKFRTAKGKARVTFAVDPRAGAQAAAVCGEWNDWSADADVNAAAGLVAPHRATCPCGFFGRQPCSW